MNWGGIQRERASFLKAYDSLAMAVLRVASAIIAPTSVLLILASMAALLPWPYGGLGLILLGPSLAILSFHLYVTYLRDHPDYLISSSLKGKCPLNTFDYTALRALLAFQRHKSWQAFWRETFKDSSAANIMLRLGLTNDLLMTRFANRPVGEKDPAELVQRLREEYPEITIDHFLVLKYLIKKDAEIGQLLRERGVATHLAAVMVDLYRSHHVARRTNKYWLPGHSLPTGGFAKEWATSYTNLLDRYTEEITPHIAERSQLFPVYDRAKFVDQVVTELTKSSGQNLLFVGPSGIGRTELFLTLAARVLTYQTKTELDGYQVRILRLEGLLGSAANSSELSNLFGALLSELVRAKRVILFVPEFDLLLANNTGDSGDLIHLLSDYLSDPRLHVIGTITPELYFKLIKTKPLLSRQIVGLEVPPPSGDDLERILLSHLPFYEARYRVFVPLSALQAIITLGARYLKTDPPPTKELSLLEEVSAAAHTANERVISPEVVNKTVERLTHVRIQVDEGEQQLLMNLEEKLHERIIGQRQAVKVVADALLRSRAGLSRPDKPIGTFLFLGPTGVGKTETAKALAAVYFGNDQALIRLDMAEFAESGALERLLGTDPVKNPGALSIAIQQTPSAVVLLDEFEKASPEARNIFLELLDEGRLTTGYGKVLDFSNTIVIATSNAGSSYIKEAVEQRSNLSQIERQLLDLLIRDRIFSPELLNRFDATVVYLPLTYPEVRKIVDLQLAELIELVRQQKGIEIEVAPKVADELARRGYDPVYGARAMQRIIHQDLETAIAREIVVQGDKPGTRVVINTLG